MAAVDLTQVWVYTDGVPLLEEVTLSVKENDFLSIIGPNGAGKTTLLKVILGLVTPAKGTVTVFGMSPRRGRTLIGYLPQNMTVDVHFPISVFDVVLLGRYTKLFRQYSDTDKKIALDTLKTVDMAAFRDRQVGTLSGGELQRVLLARALVREPKLLLLDEPTASIDPEMRKSFYELLLTLKERMSIILVTHDVTAVSTYVDNVACLNRKLFYHGSAEGALEKLEDVYQCPVEVLAHGIPHRVLKRHEHDRDTSV